MRQSSFNNMGCPIAGALEHFGDWWSLLIMRDALDGFTRFDEFQENLGIAPNILTRRLKSLTAAGLLERRQYSERPARYEYLLTESGRDLGPVIVALYLWGIKHTDLDHHSVVLVDQDSGAEIEPVYVDRRSGRPLREIRAVFAAGRAATDQMRRRHDPETKAALRDRALRSGARQHSEHGETR